MRRFLKKVLREIGVPTSDFVEYAAHTYTRMETLHQIAMNDSAVKLDASRSNEDVIVSLTTYGARIDDVYLVIESIFQQTYKPNRIVLWLDEQEFNDDNIPLILKKQQARGLTIGYCKNIKSYKKLVPTLELYPDSIIITIDDDKLYPYDLVERLMAVYRQDSKCIYFTRGRLIGKDENGKMLPYDKWELIGARKPLVEDSSANNVIKSDPMLTMPTGVGGVLYPPHSLHPDVSKEELFMQLCPHADDIWFKAMSFMQGTISKYVYINKPFARNFLTIPCSQSNALTITNVKESQNDTQLKRVLSYYDITF